MKYKKQICILSTLAFVLIICTFLSISNSFSYEYSAKEYPIWNVYLKDENNKIDNNSFVSPDTIEIKTILRSFNSSKDYIYSINNSGNILATIDNVYINGLEEIVGISSITNQTYYLKDYVDISVSYKNDNEKNKVLKDMNLKKGDLLVPNTSNNILINIKRKDEKELVADALYVLKKYKQVSGNEIPLEVNSKIKIKFKEE